jgi:hypothetical protein
MRRILSEISLSLLIISLATSAAVAADIPPPPSPDVSRIGEVLMHARAADGFRGIWYDLHVTGDKAIPKYSGGLGTFPHSITPMAEYSPAANKTFFVWGGADSKNRLQTVISYYDHATRQVARPRILREYTTNDAHDTASITIAPDGKIWIFSTVHGNDKQRKGEIFCSAEPYSIDDWLLVPIPPNLDPDKILNYTQPWQAPGEGMLLLFTRYTNGRQRYFSVTRDGGETWAPRVKLSELPGHYQISWRDGQRIGCVFDRHINKAADSRTDLFYNYTDDFGKTWRNAAGEAVPVPITSIKNNSLVRPYSDEGRLVYIKDVKFDAQRNPVILYVTSGGPEPGPKNDPRRWELAHWTGKDWKFVEMAEADHNYDHGALYVEADGTWRVIAPTGDGPQQSATGGEVSLWLSKDQGATWTSKPMTAGSRYNHSYIRGPFNAQPDFYAFWVDGNPTGSSKSSLYYCDRDGQVFRLPYTMDADMATAERLPTP